MVLAILHCKLLYKKERVLEARMQHQNVHTKDALPIFWSKVFGRVRDEVHGSIVLLVIELKAFVNTLL